MATRTPVVVVTGGAQGIGFGIASCFARKKARLVILDVNGKKAAAAAARLEKQGATGAISIVVDITKREEIEGMVAAVKKKFGGIDVLVNNAGICPFVEVMEMEPKVWQKSLDINLTGAFNCTQIVAREMIAARRGGRIIFITSLAEEFTSSAQVEYGASKAGLRMTMRGFCMALGKYGITCNAVAPGMILTPLTAFHWGQPGPAAYIKTRVPIGRIGTPVDIGNAAVFLASREADYISGVTLRVDGGYTVSCP